MKILVADDDRVSLRLLQAMLERWGWTVLRASDGHEALHVLRATDAPRVAILDWMMPGLEGPAVCRELRDRPPGAYVYTILLSGRDGKEDRVSGLDAGADDYLTKPFDAHELRVRLRAGRRILELQETLLQAQEVLRDEARHDPLTGLWNRRHAIEHLEGELSRAAREAIPVSALMADLDHFKRINDEYGHIAGDAVLRVVADRLRRAVRVYDTVARLGGEEFLIAMPGTGMDEAARAAERVRTAIGSEPMDTSDGLIEATVSIGVATSNLSPGGDAAAKAMELLRAADEALYRAKNGGRDRVALAGVSAIPARSPAPRGRPALPA